MSIKNDPCLFWEHGTLLQPQHFQLTDRRLLSCTALALSMASPHPWGLLELSIQESGIELMNFTVDRLHMVLETGEEVELGRNAVLPPRSFKDVWEDAEQPLMVYVGIAPYSMTGPNVTVVPSVSVDAVTGTRTRYVVAEEPTPMPETLAGGEQADVRLMHYNLRLLFGDEVLSEDAPICIPLMRLVREGGVPHADPNYTPPCLDLFAFPQLSDAVKEVRNALVSRVTQLQDFKIPLGTDNQAGEAAVTMRGLIIYSMLCSLSRIVPVIDHVCETGRIHPWIGYAILREVAGVLSILAPGLLPTGESENGVRAIPPYDHLDPGAGYAAARLVIMRLCNLLAAGPAHSFPMERTGDMWSYHLPNHARSGYSFWIQIRSTSIHSLHPIMASLARFAPESLLQVLLTRSLPGIDLTYSDITPAGLPRRPDTSYWRINSADALWSVINQTGACGLYLPGAPDDTEVHIVLMTESAHISVERK